MVVVRMDASGGAELCKTDEVGELCLAAPYSGQGYWGLDGLTNNQFKVSDSSATQNISMATVGSTTLMYEVTGDQI